MKKLSLLVAGGAGYVLGARAGRERYEQIMAQARKVSGNPRVQQAAHQAQDVVTTQAAAAADVAKEKAEGAAHAAADKVRGQSSPSSQASPSSANSQTPTPGQPSVPPAP
ncbi:hypothetical protein HOQ23_02965 [Nocardioides sp. zg-DK7169]|nr:hypothetical protein [Nocardioides sp. zg-DK7169]